MSSATARVVSSPPIEITQEIDWIYHSETPEDMRLKIALSGHTFTFQTYLALCDTLCYHYGFWPHTRARFESFKRLMKGKTEMSNPFIDLFRRDAARVVDTMSLVVDDLVHDYEHFPLYKVPGRRDEIRAWKMLFKLARSLEERLIVLDAKTEEQEKAQRKREEEHGKPRRSLDA